MSTEVLTSFRGSEMPQRKAQTRARNRLDPARTHADSHIHNTRLSVAGEGHEVGDGCRSGHGGAPGAEPLLAAVGVRPGRGCEWPLSQGFVRREEKIRKQK